MRLASLEDQALVMITKNRITGPPIKRERQKVKSERLEAYL